MNIDEAFESAVNNFKKRGIKYPEMDDEIKRAIKNALNDFTFRTTEKKEEVDIKGIDGLFNELCIDSPESLLNRFRSYKECNFKDQKAFDNWHKDTCKSVYDVLDGLYKNIKYGKAQKIVNMTFKYLYCINSNRGRDYFTYCHIPLDSVILDWIWDNEFIMPYESNDSMPKKLQHGYFDNWSNLDYDSKDDITEDNKRQKHYTYMFFQKLIRDFCNGKQITPLQLEFLVWPQYQWEQAAKAFCKQTENLIDKSDETKSENANGYYNRIKDLLCEQPILIDWENDLE